MRPFALAAIVALACVPGAIAQERIRTVEELAFERPEAWAQKYFTSVAMLTGFGAPRPAEPWSVELGAEAAWVPSLSDGERMVGFEGTKREDLNKTDVFGRLGVTIGLPGRVSATLTYTPPVEVGGARPHLVGAAFARPLREWERVRLGLSLHGQAGEIEGDFTCSAREVAAGSDPVVNPFGCEAPSADELRTRYAGVELSAAFPRRGGVFEPWVSASLNHIDTEFRVRARYSGLIDRSVLRTDGWTTYYTAGCDLVLGGRARIAGEVFYSPLTVVRPPAMAATHDDLLHVRLLMRWLAR